MSIYFTSIIVQLATIVSPMGWWLYALTPIMVPLYVIVNLAVSYVYKILHGTMKDWGKSSDVI